MRVKWYGQSAFELAGEATTVFVDPFGDVSAALDGVRVAHFGDFGQAALRDEQEVAIGAVDLLLAPVGGQVTLDAEQARAVVDRLAPR